MKYFMAVLLGVSAALASGAGAPAQVAGTVAAPQIFAQRAIESISGQLADLQPGTLPDELEKRVPLPRGAQLLGSAVFTPIQYFGAFGARGSLEIFYDGAALDLQRYPADLERAGWLPHGPAGAATLYCKADEPSVIVIMGPRPTSMRLSVSRNHPGVDACLAK
ncbi:MAG: hypothetical protein ABR584_08575 [Candidatus Baltobacteraceae bacterium]